MASIAMPTGNYSLSRVISGTFTVIMGSWLPLFGFMAVITAVCCAWAGFSVMQLIKLYGSLGSPDVVTRIFLSPYLWSSAALVTIASMMMQAGIMAGFAAADANGSARIADCFAGGIRFLLPMTGLMLFWSLAIGMGLVLLIVPGLILLTMWSVCMPALVVERAGIFGALSRSQALTRGFRWPVFGTLALFWVINSMASSGVQSLLSTGLLLSPDLIAGLAIVVMVTNLMLTTLTSAFLFTLYQELRRAKGETDEAMLAGIFA